MKKAKPAAFVSYVRSDDKSRRLTEFCERLSEEVRMHIGGEFPIFQDRKHIQWGQNWRERIDQSLDEVTFLIAIITPAFFKSRPCCYELQRFLEREKKLKRNDLVLPVYYVDCPVLNNKEKRAANRFAQEIAKRQYADWRDFRFEPLNSTQAAKTLARLAAQIRDALERVETPKKKVAARKTSPATGPGSGTRRQSKGSEPASAKATPPAKKRVAPRKAGSTTRTKKLAGRPGTGSGRASAKVRPAAKKKATPRKGKRATPAATRAGAKSAPRPVIRAAPRTHVVDKTDQGDYRTITEAIAKANAGDRILVRPGYYVETLWINKPLEIIGYGDVEKIKVSVDGTNALLFEATRGRVVNLSLSQRGKEFTVNIVRGRLELEDCDIISLGGGCVLIGEGAQPRLRRNRIHNGETNGVGIYGNPGVILDSNQIFDLRVGVYVYQGDPILWNNRIFSCFTGVQIASGKAILEYNDIYSNKRCGVEIFGHSTLRRNHVRDCGEYGVELGSGQGTLEDNDIVSNKGHGVHISGGDPVLRYNRIKSNGASGVHVSSIEPRGTVENNDLRDNRQGAWSEESRRFLQDETTHSHNQEY